MVLADGFCNLILSGILDVNEYGGWDDSRMTAAAGLVQARVVAEVTRPRWPCLPLPSPHGTALLFARTSFWR